MFTHWSGPNYGHGEGSSSGETEGWGSSTGKSYSTGRSNSISIGTPIESLSLWSPSKYTSVNARVWQAAAPLERRLRVLSEQLSVAEFHALRTRLEDCCDEILLNHLP